MIIAIPALIALGAFVATLYIKSKRMRILWYVVCIGAIVSFGSALLQNNIQPEQSIEADATIITFPRPTPTVNPVYFELRSIKEPEATIKSEQKATKQVTVQITSDPYDNPNLDDPYGYYDHPYWDTIVKNVTDPLPTNREPLEHAGNIVSNAWGLFKDIFLYRYTS